MEGYMKTIFKIIFIILGGIVGSGIGGALSNVDALNWLSFGAEVGSKSPIILDLSFVQLTFGIWCKINVAGVLCLLIFAFLSNKVIKWIKI